MTTLPFRRLGLTDEILERARAGPREEGYAGVNVGYTERALSGAVGLPLVALGVKRGGLGGIALAITGGFLAYRAATGYCHVYHALDLDSAHDAMRKEVKIRNSVCLPIRGTRFTRQQPSIDIREHIINRIQNLESRAFLPHCFLDHVQ